MHSHENMSQRADWLCLHALTSLMMVSTVGQSGQGCRNYKKDNNLHVIKIF